MPGKREQFRFRIPWISGSSTRPKQTSNSPAQLHTKYTPTQRPPFRPPEKASLPPQHPLHTTAPASGLQKETRETTVERKMMLAIGTSNPSGKDIKVTADPMTTRNNVSTISKDDVPDFVNKVATVIPTEQPIDEKTVSVVTLAGENRGATMNVADSHSQSTRKKGSINIHRTNQEKEEEKDETGKACVNSNIQSMNNSFMLRGSINGRDPGVRVIFPQQNEAEDKRGLENNNNNNNNNNISRVERSTYRPMVRRRCLRGLFHEPSDSDPDKPNKPRRHGCKFSCGDVRKDKDPDIF